MQSRDFDVVVMGAGIVGSMIARALSRYAIRVALVDRANDVGTGASCANSAILHSGHDPSPGSLKAEMNRRGNELWHDLVHELEVGHRWTGAMIIALGDEQLPGLKKLLARGTENQIPGLEIISRAEVLKREPLLTPDVSGALWTPTAGVIDPFGGTVAAAENAVTNGVSLFLNAEIHDALVSDGTLIAVQTTAGEFRARWFINALGVHADDFMHLAGDRPDFAITARRGEYFIFDPNRVQVQNVLFPMPTDKGKGILVSTTAHGNTFVGPNAEEVADKEDTTATRDGMAEILEGGRRLIPSLESRDIIAGFSGVRATGNANRDFVIEISATVGGLLNVAGIESPGYVSAPAIAERVEGLLRNAGLEMVAKNEWNPRRPARPAFKELNHEQRSDLIRRNPNYGRIVCRCENVTEGEIVDAIHSPVPARDYDAIKRRCWLGTGRCQGSFDYPRVMEILSRELDIPMTAVTKKGPGSEFLARTTKG
ncbi:MAG: FAD/NAD(P)-binding oxidoreductase [Spirochaetaceae bacterium]|nr:MAG: FAD/NAD(P)-binding oxidoreductase [Spirochaetaceae bacterium]